MDGRTDTVRDNKRTNIAILQRIGGHGVPWSWMTWRDATHKRKYLTEGRKKELTGYPGNKVS